MGWALGWFRDPIVDLVIGIAFSLAMVPVSFYFNRWMSRTSKKRFIANVRRRQRDLRRVLWLTEQGRAAFFVGGQLLRIFVSGMMTVGILVIAIATAILVKLEPEATGLVKWASVAEMWFQNVLLMFFIYRVMVCYRKLDLGIRPEKERQTLAFMISTAHADLLGVDEKSRLLGSLPSIHRSDRGHQAASSSSAEIS
ncbi:hypothetical protein ACXHMN_18740 [Rhizobium sp. LEGMi12c]